MKKGIIFFVLLLVVVGLSYAAPKAQVQESVKEPFELTKEEEIPPSACETLVKSCRSAALDGDLTKRKDLDSCFDTCGQAQNACRGDRENLTRANAHLLHCRNSQKK